MTALVDEIDAGPHIVGPCAPGLLAVVDGDRVGEAAVNHFCPEFLDVVLGFRFGRMNAENHQSLRGELVVPTLVPRVITDAVDSSVGKEIQGHDLTAQLFERQRFAVDPAVNFLQTGCFVGQGTQTG